MPPPSAALLAGGCANPETQPSAVPWNQPTTWESGGAAGSMMGR